ncbi:MAG: radical SAM protein, partial [Desulfobacula sp.]|uniref:radical SAM protein n=1 Tax=Desulfobacula sp. TaxID=2593537 RepID=UPI0025C67F2F
MTKKTNHGMLFIIQRSSIHDGPGVRTVLFLKGCPLRCVWCQNPESQNTEIEHKNTVCPDGQNSKITIGNLYSPEQAFIEIEKDKIFYKLTRGGVTFSGGEPTLQLRFLKDLVRICKSENIHMVLETCGYFQYDAVIKTLMDIDLIYFDIKIIDSKQHLNYTSKTNTKIIQNLKNLYLEHPNVLVRYVSVPELNSRENHLNQFVSLLQKLKINDVSILKYNHLWLDKTKDLPQAVHRIKDYTFEEIESCWKNSIAALEKKGLLVVNKE